MTTQQLSSVDWDHPQQQKRTVKGKDRQVTVYVVTCLNHCPDGNLCGNMRFLTGSDARKAGKCFRCAQIEKAPKGYRGLIEKRGPEFAIEKVQAHQLAHPSRPTSRIIDLLNQMGVQYEREVLLKYEDRRYLLDFVVNGHSVIEVDGQWVHSHHQQRDQRKHNAIRNAGYRLLPLSDQDLNRAGAIISDYLDLPLLTGVR